MPSKRSPSTDTEKVRLAGVFVRLPNDPRQQQSDKPTAAAPKQTRRDSGEAIPPSTQHRNPMPSSPPFEPHTPQKPAKTSNPIALPIPHPHLPPTPDPTPTKKSHGLKRSASSSSPTSDPQTPPPSIKRPRTTTTPPTPSPHSRRRLFPRTPKFSIAYQAQPPLREGGRRVEEGEGEGEEGKEETMSWLELKRASESIMRQVDWTVLAEDVASNRGAGAYKKFVRGVLQRGTDELAGREEGGR